MMKKLAHALICCIAAAAIAGCATSPQPRFYMLSSTPLPERVPAVSCSLSVGPVFVPAAVDRPQIVIRTGKNEVFINEFERWAAPLKNDIGRIVAENLVSMLGTKQVTLFPQAAAAGASYRVAIDVLRLFRTGPEGFPGRALDGAFREGGKVSPGPDNAHGNSKRE